MEASQRGFRSQDTLEAGPVQPMVRNGVRNGVSYVTPINGITLTLRILAHRKSIDEQGVFCITETKRKIVRFHDTILSPEFSPCLHHDCKRNPIPPVNGLFIKQHILGRLTFGTNMKGSFSIGKCNEICIKFHQRHPLLLGSPFFRWGPLQIMKPSTNPGIK